MNLFDQNTTGGNEDPMENGTKIYLLASVLLFFSACNRSNDNSGQGPVSSKITFNSVGKIYREHGEDKSLSSFMETFYSPKFGYVT